MKPFTFYVLNYSFVAIGIIDNYKSAIWTERFYICGDFEIYCPNVPDNYGILQLDSQQRNVYILRADDPTKIGILTNVKYTHDADSGEMIIATGKTDDYILHSRVFCEQSTYNGNIEYAIRNMIRNNLIADEFNYTYRNVSNISLGFKVGLTDKISVQFFGTYLDEEIEKLTQAYGFGYQFDYDHTNKHFTFNLLKSTDRSLDQQTNTPIIFSAKMDNLTKSEYEQNEYPNVAYAIGSGTGIDRYIKRYSLSQSSTGLNLKECAVNGENLSNNGDSMNEWMYLALLEKLAQEQMFAQKNNSEIMAGETIPNMNYKLGVDYFLGDIVQTIIEIDHTEYKSMKQRVTEIIECYDETGYSCLPTFETVQ